MASGRGAEVAREEVDAEEDYIDMDLSSSVAAGRPVAREEFEFMSAPLDRQGEPLASPADELFYKGNLLPLHLPPRIQMVEGLLDGHGGGVTLLGYSTAPATPYESCHASPAQSRFVSGELNVEEYFQKYKAGLVDAAAAGERKSWSRKLKFVRQLNLGLKLKASKAYLKTIFAAKSGNADDDKSNVHGATTRELSRVHHEHSHGHLRTWRKNPFGQIRSNRYIASHSRGSSGVHAEPEGGRHKEREHGHRRSFSSVTVRCSSSNKTSPPPTLPSSVSSSCSTSTSPSASSSVRTSSDSDGGAPALRTSSASSEVENPIQGLIAYCKKSQQLASVRKSASDTGFRFLSSSSSKIAAESDGLDMDELIANLQRMKM
jgi:hypothetical protein